MGLASIYTVPPELWKLLDKPTQQNLTDCRNSLAPRDSNSTDGRRSFGNQYSRGNQSDNASTRGNMVNVGDMTLTQLTQVMGLLQESSRTTPFPPAATTSTTLVAASGDSVTPDTTTPPPDAEQVARLLSLTRKCPVH
jgi:hypothetical protein